MKETKSINRRAFLRGACGLAACAAVAPAIVPANPRGICAFFSGLWASFKKYRAECVIARALETVEGREAMSMAMVEPIREALRRQSEKRMFLPIDELPNSVLDRYVNMPKGVVTP